MLTSRPCESAMQALAAEVYIKASSRVSV